MTLELISFNLCPFVQRSVITLLYLKQNFKLTYIDLENTPHWFDSISPLGKVPILRVHSSDVIFESHVINEYINEINQSTLLSPDPLQRAIERSWIQFCSELITHQYEMLLAQSAREFEALQDVFFSELIKVNSIASPTGPYFRGDHFTLVDAAFAPLFRNLMIFPQLKESDYWKKAPPLRSWAESLLQLDVVQKAVSADFPHLYQDYLRTRGSHLAQETKNTRSAQR